MRSQSGFTLIEILMVVLLVSILAAVSIPQFIDFRTEAKDAATQSAAGALRSAIANQYANIAIRCNAPKGTFPTTVQMNANDITAVPSQCTTTEIAAATERQLVAGSAIPDNPWSGGAVKNTVIECTAGAGCDQTDATACDGNAYAATSGGWCYNPLNGAIWANSQNSTSTVKENNF